MNTGKHETLEGGKEGMGGIEKKGSGGGGEMEGCKEYRRMQKERGWSFRQGDIERIRREVFFVVRKSSAIVFDLVPRSCIITTSSSANHKACCRSSSRIIAHTKITYLTPVAIGPIFVD